MSADDAAIGPTSAHATLAAMTPEVSGAAVEAAPSPSVVDLL
ncbi:MAG TPA: hypothetical protein VN790_01685 [Steroidobacteraceae bacterium]|nr:hypothetical protein [Steroidobacteraceae bacterium]